LASGHLRTSTPSIDRMLSPSSKPSPAPRRSTSAGTAPGPGGNKVWGGASEGGGVGKPMLVLASHVGAWTTRAGSSTRPSLPCFCASITCRVQTGEVLASAASRQALRPFPLRLRQHGAADLAHTFVLSRYGGCTMAPCLALLARREPASSRRRGRRSSGSPRCHNDGPVHGDSRAPQARRPRPPP